ncbi:MAG: hypothetical protein MK193_08160 [Lentisphaeria bacterium]|nr:hypothetical protein [Lentisphaeria bacterium]
MKMILLFLCLFLFPARAQVLSESLYLEGHAARDRAIHFLLKKQKEDGSWSGQYGYSALIGFTLALADPDAKDIQTSLNRLDTFLLKANIKDMNLEQDPYSLSTMLIYFSLRNQEHTIAFENEMFKKLLNQQLFQVQNKGHMVPNYSERKYPDFSNTHWALEAFAISQNRVETQLNLKWKANQKYFIDYIFKFQVIENKDPNFGAFRYTPPFMELKLQANEVYKQKVFASLTLGALKSLLYCETEQDLQPVKKWILNHYSLTDNIGLGKGGLYYYYYMLISTYELCLKTDPALKRLPNQLMIELLQKQKWDGAWQNKNNLWLENQKEVATAYALLTITILLNNQ